MLPKQLFFLTNEHLCAYQWQRGRLSEPRHFLADRAGMDAFSQYLRENPDRPAYLIADMVEEDFQRQLLPHVSGRARRGLIARRMNLAYRDTPFRHALIQGREAAGRRDDLVLFSAITNPGAVQPWVNVIGQAGVPLGALYSAPFLAMMLVRSLAMAQDHLLLITIDSAGLRQTYFQGRHLKFSRLTTMTAAERLADVVAEETDRMQQFLTSTRLTGRGDLLQTVVLAPRDEIPALEQQCEDGPEIAFHFVDMETAAARLRMREVPRLADTLLLTLVGRNPPASHYPTGAPGHLFRLWQTRIGLYAGSAGLVTAALAATVYNVWATLDANSTAARLTAEAPQFEARYRAVMATLPPAAARTVNMRAAVTVDETLRMQGPQPLALTAIVSDSLDRAPAITLLSLEWQVPSGAPPSAGGAANPLQQAGQPTDAPAPIYSSALGIPSPPPQTVRIEGEIDAPENDSRAVLDAMNAFALDLARNRRLAVDIVSPPVDVRSNARLSGKAGLATEPGKPRFALRVTWKP